MSVRRFAVVLALLVAGVVLLLQYVGAQRSKRTAVEPTAATQPAAATAPATAPTTAPANTASAPASAPGAGAASQPPTQAAAETQPGKKTRQRFVYRPGETQLQTLGSLDVASGFNFQVALTSTGAAVENLKLARYFATVDDKRLYEKSPQDYEAARKADPEKYQGHYVLLNAVGRDDSIRLPLATRRLWVSLPDSGSPEEIPLDNKKWSLAAPTTQGQDVQEVRFSFRLGQDLNWKDPSKPQDVQPLLELVKIYTIRKGSFSLGMALQIRNLSPLPLRVDLDQGGPYGIQKEDTRGDDDRRVVYGEWKKADEKIQPRAKDRKELDKLNIGEPAYLGGTEGDNPVLWLGETNKFFASLLYLQPGPGTQGLAASGFKAAYYVSAADEGGTRKWLTGIRFGAMELAPNASREASFDLFAGPKLRDLFNDVELYKKLDYISLIDMGGSCGWCAPSWLTLGLMWLLQKFSFLAFGNYGVAIILLVFLVRLLLHPLTKKGQVSMSKMQKLAPQMQKLKEKYADDKNALNKEMMQLYKQAGATPILGCLPMFLQMPIWIALWTALNATVELRHAAFLPFWIVDLAAPDRLLTWKSSLPLIGNSFNLLPILLTIGMYFQTKMTPQMGEMSAQQASQQKMMKIMMPAMMLFFFYNAPSGLTLYIMASTFAGVVEQVVIRKHIEQREAQAAMAETAVDLPGKRSRTSRPKKPKGPGWIKGK